MQLDLVQYGANVTAACDPEGLATRETFDMVHSGFGRDYQLTKRTGT